MSPGQRTEQKNPISLLSSMPRSPFNVTEDALPASAQRRNAAGVSGPGLWRLVFNRSHPDG